MRVGVLVSGVGTNLQALIDAEAAGHLAAAELAVVIASRPDAPALERARRAGLSTEVLHRPGAPRDEYDAALASVLDAHRVELVVLAGFMRILGAPFVARYPSRIINTHPSLLPAFPGANAPAQAIAYGAQLSGVTIHFVDATVDGGPIIAQAMVAVYDDDTAETLHDRIKHEEHRLLPIVVQRLARGLVSCKGRRVVGGRAE
jgi:phosphoribosylglycinamide formyltransferase 1